MMSELRPFYFLVQAGKGEPMRLERVVVHLSQTEAASLGGMIWMHSLDDALEKARRLDSEELFEKLNAALIKHILLSSS